MEKINFTIIFLLIFACAGTQKKRLTVKDSQKNAEITIHSQHWNIEEDSLNLFLHMGLPLNQFVFRKSSDHFYSYVTYTLVISHAEKNIQVYRESWNEKVTQPYYEDTRNPNNFFTTERNITLAPGTYKLFLNVQDEDSRRNWQLNEEYELKPVDILGPILPFCNNEDLQKIIALNIMGEMDTIWLRTQIHLQDTITEQIDYLVNWKTTPIDSGKINISGMGNKQLYYIPIAFKEPKRGWYKIILSFQGVEQSASFNFGNTGDRYWTDDIDELVSVMRYILPTHSEYKKLNDMNEPSQWDYIQKYWEGKDPSPETSENELLIQLNYRVKFVNKNFSILGHGWRSDRGRIYIIYGSPQHVEESYQDQMGYTFKKWVYPNGKQFIFIDRNMSGDYSLYREMF